MLEYNGTKDPTDLKAAKDFILFYSGDRRSQNDFNGYLTVVIVYTRQK